MTGITELCSSIEPRHPPGRLLSTGFPESAASRRYCYWRTSQPPISQRQLVFAEAHLDAVRVALQRRLSLHPNSISAFGRFAFPALGPMYGCRMAAPRGPAARRLPPWPASACPLPEGGLASSPPARSESPRLLSGVQFPLPATPRLGSRVHIPRLFLTPTRGACSQRQQRRGIESLLPEIRG
jgi:hypothetical protein